MEQNSYKPEPEPNSVEIALEKVNKYRSTIEEIQSDQSLTDAQKEYLSSQKAIEYHEDMESLPEKIQIFAMYAQSSDDELLHVDWQSAA